MFVWFCINQYFFILCFQVWSFMYLDISKYSYIQNKCVCVLLHVCMRWLIWWNKITYNFGTVANVLLHELQKKCSSIFYFILCSILIPLSQNLKNCVVYAYIVFGIMFLTTSFLVNRFELSLKLVLFCSKENVAMSLYFKNVLLFHFFGLYIVLSSLWSHLLLNILKTCHL